MLRSAGYRSALFRAELIAIDGETTTTAADGFDQAVDSDGDGNDFGAGFAECTWEVDDSELVVSVVPAANCQSDYIDQLNVGAPVDSANLGPDAVEFLGLVATQL